VHLKRRIEPGRLQRVLVRARPAPAPHPGEPARDRCAPPNTLSDCWVDEPAGRRRNRRVGLTSQIALRRTGGNRFEARLSNLSVGGCAVLLAEPLAARDRVIARLPGLEPLAARVTWTDVHSAGLDFERPMHPAVLETLLARLS
jgi:hypothetical protein